ncbi:MAG: Gfo/Idh/MocA family oxidoreductase [Acidobacteriaceae bacterium]|nr:Gfo/Idh/MocA family oxidoreductase [Acidobacteriaceae bacterium]
MTHEPRVAVVGCGYWGKNLVRNFHELGHLELICDVDGDRPRHLAAQYSVSYTPDYEAVLRNPLIEGIAIAAPAVRHYELAQKAMLAGKDVFVEKPLALHVEHGEELLQLSKRLGRILMVGHILQYHPAMVELGRMIRAGELGKIQYVYSSRLNLGKLRTEENILWSFAPHDISAIVGLLGEAPVTVCARGAGYLNHEISDTTLSTFDFASGVKAHIFVSWLHPFKEQKLVVVGERKMAVFDDTETEHKLVTYPHRIDWVDRVPVARKADREIVQVDNGEPLRLELEHFLNCITNRQRPRTDGENGLQVLRILDACERSMKQHGDAMPLLAQPKRYEVHPTAVVDQPCQVGDGTHIWHFSHVMANCSLGRNCNLGQNVHIAPGVTIGNNVKIQNNVSVYTGVELEDDVFCGPSMVFTNVINPRSKVNRKNEYLPTLVKRGATLGANSTIVCGVTIGAYAFIAAGAVVTRDVPEYALMMGVPAKQVGWICECGQRLYIAAKPKAFSTAERAARNGRSNLTATTCDACGLAYELEGSGLRRAEFRASEAHAMMSNGAAQLAARA